MSLTSPPRPGGARVAPLAEDYRETPLWWDDTAFPTLPETTLPKRADAVIVGASTKAGHRFVGSLAVHLVRASRWPITVVP